MFHTNTYTSSKWHIALEKMSILLLLIMKSELIVDCRRNGNHQNGKWRNTSILITISLQFIVNYFSHTCAMVFVLFLRVKTVLVERCIVSKIRYIALLKQRYRLPFEDLCMVPNKLCFNVLSPKSAFLNGNLGQQIQQLMQSFWTMNSMRPQKCFVTSDSTTKTANIEKILRTKRCIWRLKSPNCYLWFFLEFYMRSWHH